MDQRLHAWSLPRPGRIAILAVAALGAFPIHAEEGKKPRTPPVTVEAVRVSPEKPGPDTLCKLAVRVNNRAERSVSGLGFTVKVNGIDLPVYENQRYLETIDPGETREISLFNFWSSETHRPPRKDGSLQVEVAVTEARWVEMTMEDEVPTWTLLEPVKKLPGALKVRKPFPDTAKPDA